MEEFGDYIYIVVLVIAALASVFKKRKKREEAQTAAAPQFPDLSDVISEDKGNVYEHVFVEPEKSFQEVIAEKFEAAKTKFEIRDTPTSKYESDAYAKGKIDDLPIIEEPTWLDSMNLEDVEEAKRAFIYSEIMTRKYS